MRIKYFYFSSQHLSYGGANPDSTILPVLISILKKAAHFGRKMERRFKTEQGTQLYKKRGPVSEGAYHIIKNLIGFREFQLGGLSEAMLEWDLLTLASNYLRMVRLKSHA